MVKGPVFQNSKKFFAALASLLLVVFLSTQATASSEIHWNTRLSEALEKSEMTGKPVFLDVCADWCSPCKMMDEAVFCHKDVCRYINSSFIPLRLDYDENQDVIQKYQVLKIPMMLVLEQDGQTCGRVSGLVPPEKLVEKLSRVLKARQEFPRLEKRFEENPEDPRIRYQLGQTASILDRQSLAIEHLEKAIEMDPSGDRIEPGKASITLAQAYVAKNDFESAIRMLESYLAKHPQSSHQCQALFYLGAYALKNQQTEKAKEHLQAALDASEKGCDLEPQLVKYAQYTLSKLE